MKNKAAAMLALLEEPARRLEDLPDLLTTSELAGYLSVAEQTVRNWRMTGRGPRARRIGGRVLYHRDDIATFVNAS